MNINSRQHIVLSAVISLVIGSASASAQADSAMAAASGVAATAAASGVAATGPRGVYVMVNGTPITTTEYNAELTTLLKERYYHGRIPERKAQAVRKELTNTMIDRILMIQEAERRGVKPDEAAVDKIIAKFESRGKLSGPNHDRLVSEIKDVEGKRSQLKKLEELVRTVPPPTDDEVKAYYDSHKQLFTTPEQLHLSVILVSVDPSSTVNVWAEALTKANGIYDQIKGKSAAEFADLARKISGDKSAAGGGDLGYLHRGMLPGGLEDQVDKFKVGEVAPPVKLLEGMGVFRLEDRVPAAVVGFDRSKERAAQLLNRDNQNRAWKDFMDNLRKSAKIEIYNIPEI